MGFGGQKKIREPTLIDNGFSTVNGSNFPEQPEIGTVLRQERHD